MKLELPPGSTSEAPEGSAISTPAGEVRLSCWTELMRRARASCFVRDVLTLSGASIFTSAIPILAAPINARLYTPEAYGTWAILMAITGLVGILAYGHFPQLFFLEKDECALAKLLAQAMRVVLLFSGGMLCVLPFILLSLKALGKGESYASYLMIAPLLVFLAGMNSVLSLWLNRRGQFGRIAANRVFQSLALVASQIVLGYLVGGVEGLLLSYCIGLVVGLWHLASMGENFPAMLNTSLKHSEILLTVKKNRQLFSVSLPSEFINNLSNQLPVFMLTAYGTPAMAGYYNMSTRIIGLPVTFLTGSVSEVFKARASRLYLETGDCRSLVLQTVAMMLGIVVVPFMLCMVFAPVIFSQVLGEQWQEAGRYAQWVGVLYFCKVVISPVSYVVFLARKFWVSLMMDILVLVVSLVTLLIGLRYFDSVAVALISYATAYATLYSITLYYSLKFAKRS